MRAGANFSDPRLGTIFERVHHHHHTIVTPLPSRSPVERWRKPISFCIASIVIADILEWMHASQFWPTFTLPF